MKTRFRIALFGLLGFFAWTCNVSDSKPDTLTFHVPDSLKAPPQGKYDSIRLEVFVINRQNSSDTLYRKVVFHGAYTDSSQLMNMSLGKIPSRDFTVVVSAYRAGVKALIIGLPFNDGKAGTPDTILTPKPNRRPKIFLAPPDSGKTAFRVKEGWTLAFKVSANDSDGGDSILLSRPVNLPSSCGPVTFDTITGNFIFKPAFSCLASGTDSLVTRLKFTARDNGNPSSSDSLVLDVTALDSNSAPQWARDSTGALQGKEGKAMSLDLDSLFNGDRENDSVSFAASLGNIGQNPLRWTFTPSFSDSGNRAVSITATDNHKPPLASQLVLKLHINDSSRILDVVINFPPNGFVTRDTVIPVRWSVNGVGQKRDTTQRLLVEGQNRMGRDSLDTAGNHGYDTIIVILDRMPPAKPVVQGPGLTNNPKPRWTWRSGGGGSGYFRYKLDDRNLADTVGLRDSAFTPAANLSEGMHRLYAQERDSAGNWSPMDSGMASVDTTKPRVVITSPQNGLITRLDSVDVFYTVDAVAQPKVKRPLSVGLNTLWISAMDSAGNKDSASVAVTRDTLVPGNPVVAGPGLTNNPKPRWTWKSGGNGGNGFFRFKLDDKNLSADTVGIRDTAFTPPANLSEGRHALYIQERTTAGNWSGLDSGIGVVDTTKPKVKIVSPANGFATRFDSVEVVFTVDSVIQPKMKKALANGPNTLTLVGTDSAGNKDSASVIVTRDTMPPNKPTVTGPGLTKNQKPIWSWKSGGNGGSGFFRYKLDTANLSSDTVGRTDTAFTPAVNLAEGTHTLYVQERDSVGNWSAKDSGMARIDITAPVVVITSPSNGHVTNQSTVQVAWSVGGNSQTPEAKSLNEGDNTLTQSATDSAGNTGSASITVTRRSNVVFVNAAATDTNGDGNSWSKPYRFLQPALARAANGQEIWVAKGIYKPARGIPGVDTTAFDTSFVMKAGVNLYGGFVGTEKAQGLRDWKVNESVLSGERGNPADSSDNLGPIILGSGNSSLDGFVIEKGFSVIDGDAAGMQIVSGSQQILNCLFRENNGGFGGGAIDIWAVNPIISNCSFYRNDGYYGGAITNRDASPVISNCLFQDNGKNSEIGYNRAIGSVNSSPVVSACRFIGNKHGAYFEYSGGSTIQNCVFEGNSSPDFGGAYNAVGSIPKIRNSVFTSNSSVKGGAIGIQGTTLSLVNCILSENSAVTDGGAIYFEAGNNHSEIRNSILWQNHSSTRINQITYFSNASFPDTLEINYTDVEGATTYFSFSSPVVLLYGTENIQSNPIFKNSTNPSGPDGQYFTSDDGLSLSVGSPCVNTGDPSSTGLPATDITGAARVQGGRVDMGAYEQ